MKANKFLLFLLTFFFCLSFKNSDKKYYRKFQVDKKIKYSQEFKLMNKENELKMGIDMEIPKTKRTAKIVYDGMSELRCLAKINDKNQIEISIYNNDGFGAIGFEIQLHKNKFKIDPFLTNDIGGNHHYYDYEIKKQILILNKKDFKVGDSIYGFIDFEVNELYKNEDSYRPSFGKGYFRGEVKSKNNYR